MLIPINNLLLFAGAALLLALTPGPNMIYLISRSICQSRQAGVISLLGVLLGFIFHMLGAAIGLTAVFIAVPFAYEVLKWIGAAYLLWLAWEAVKPGASSPFETKYLPPDSPRKLFLMGLFTSLLNPKVAFFYLSLFPQFIVPENGKVFLQSIILGAIQIFFSFIVDLLAVLLAAGIAAWFLKNPFWLAVQRYVMGSVLAGLAVRLALERRTGV